MNFRFLVPVAMILASTFVMASDCGSGTGGAPASGTAASSTRTPTTKAVGEAMTDKGRSVTVTAFKRNYSSGNEFESPAAGKECVQVTFALLNGSKTEWLSPVYEITVVDSNGQTYETAFGCGKNDNVSSLVAGGHATVSEVYEVPSGSPLNITWRPNMFLDAVYQTALK